MMTKRWNKDQRVSNVKWYYENKGNLTKTQRRFGNTFYLWGYLKGEVYKDPAPETIQDLKRNIKREIRKINPEVLLKVCDNFVSRLQNVNAKRGAWIEHIINA